MSNSFILPELNNSFIALAYATLDGAFIDVNNSFCKIFGYKKNEILSKNIFDISHDDSHKDTHQLIAKLKRNRINPISIEKKYYSKNGKTIHAKLNVSLIRDHKTHKDLLFAEIMDLTDEREAYTKIKESEVLLRTINENAHEGIFRIFKDQFIYLNQGFLKMFNYESLEDFKVVPSALFPCDVIAKIPALKEIKGVEVIFQKSDGTEFHGLLNISLCPEYKCQQYYDGSITDITKIKEQQLQLKNTNGKLEVLNQELDMFIYSASHDLKAPIKSLKGLLDLHTLDSKNSHIYIERLKQSVKRIDEFTDDLTNHYRNYRTEKTFERVDLMHVIEESFEIMKYLPNFDNIESNITIDTTESGFYTDLVRIKILIHNLVGNAIKFHNPAQEKCYINVNVSITEENATIQISDNGIGIEDKYHLSIFNMFFRATEVAQGSGLGLYTVKSIVDKLNGDIQMKSKVGKGTTFTITLPNENEKAVQGKMGN